MNKKYITIFITLSSIVFGSTYYKMDNNYILNLVFKEINVRSGDIIFLDNNKNEIGSVISNKISNNYNIVKVQIQNETKIPINSNFNHTLVGSLRRNAVKVVFSNETVNHKDGDVVIVDFKGVTTVCDQLDSIKIVFETFSGEVDVKKNDLDQINQDIDDNNTLKWKLLKTIEIKQKDLETIDEKIAAEREEKSKVLKEIESEIELIKNQTASLTISFNNDMLIYDSLKIELDNNEKLLSSINKIIKNEEEYKKNLDSDLKQLEIKRSNAQEKLNAAEKQYNEIITFVKENVIVLKDYDTPPEPKNGKTLQSIISETLPEKLKVYTGYVIIDAFIGKNGRVESINDIKSEPLTEHSEDIEDYLIDEISSIKWRPALKEGKSVGASYKIVISFNY